MVVTQAVSQAQFVDKKSIVIHFENFRMVNIRAMIGFV